MNDNIKILLDQAHIVLNPPGTYPRYDNILPEQMEKLINSVVVKCADIAMHQVMNISTYADAEYVNEKIKEQFGVE